jgi:hypothetical protein
VSKALDDARDAQDAAEAAIQNATQAIDAAQGDLNMVSQHYLLLCVLFQTSLNTDILLRI